MTRCECGRLIWPWQESVPGFEGTTLHVKCIEDADHTNRSGA